ncbi:HAD family hydrolase [Streptomyces atroolivaceus]|uniref:HAD family hydrolase n=1 Tax=Streptomyces atroolivaceus TaxID=66869 RepID=UPI00379DCCAA
MRWKKPHMETPPALPAGVLACLFDLDGVITKTDIQHRRAWKRTFDPFLSGADGQSRCPFTLSDYLRYVDGLPRREAVHRFLLSRRIRLPLGHADEPAGHCSEHQLANRKNDLLTEFLDTEEIEAYPGSLRFVRAVRRAGLRTAVVSASSHCARILDACGLTSLFDIRVDGATVRERGLRGKPAPDPYLEAAAQLDIAPGRAAVFEDGPAGVEAAVAGAFGYVVAIDRCGLPDILEAQQPDALVHDLAELLLPSPESGPAHA